MVSPPVGSIIHSLKLVDYLSVQAYKPCSISYVFISVSVHHFYKRKQLFASLGDELLPNRNLLQWKDFTSGGASSKGSKIENDRVASPLNIYSHRKTRIVVAMVDRKGA